MVSKCKESITNGCPLITSFSLELQNCWSSGPPVLRTSGAPDCQCSGLLELQTAGAPDFWNTRPMSTWTSILLVYAIWVVTKRQVTTTTMPAAAPAVGPPLLCY